MPKEKSVRSAYPEALQAKGVDFLQSPSTYILVLIAALILYYLDQQYGLGLLYQRSTEKLSDLTEGVSPAPEEAGESLVDPAHVFLVACLVLSLVLAVKRARARRGKAWPQPEAGEVGMVLRSGRQLGPCERISHGEFSHQSEHVTRQEVRRLVQSSDYKQAMRSKGAEPEKWNWQASDRKLGIIPNEDEALAEDNFEMEQELLHIDKEMEARDLLKSSSDKYSLKLSTSLKKSGVRDHVGQGAVGKDSVSKQLRFESPSRDGHHGQTPPTRYTLRSSAHKLRSTFKQLK